ncbi:MAG: peptide ABC transporter substrate-binding protein [Chloroflexi bacterium]|nr:peptide ABC transporter substrate-binding protein [Chloroflexota bacterium]MCL5075325.1 peptide ABC transporter substrate-binding protein [Chloroflexota bacterium]
MSRSKVLSMIVMVAFVLSTLGGALSGCAAPPPPTPTPTKAAPPAAPVATPTVAVAATPTPAPPKEELAADQHLRVNIAGEPPTLDPNLSSWDASIAVESLVFEGLLKFDKDLNLVPAVAKEVPTVANGGISPDGKVYTFKLRNDVKWSDGKPVTAKDFVYGTMRLLDPKNAAEYASFYYTIVGAEEYNTALGTKAKPKKPTDEELAKLRAAVGVKALDDYTFQVTLKEPRASFNSLAALWAMYPAREDIISAKGERWTDDPATYIGNGPFKMTEWVHKDHITVVANPNYYGEKPKLQKITLLMVTDINADYAAYLAGEREIARVPLATIPSVQADPKMKDQIRRGPRLATFALQFNNKKPPFDNVKVRQAFSMAVDREAFISKIRRGVGKPAYSWIPPGMPGHQPDLGLQYKLNPQKAKELLKEAGYADPKSLPPVALQYANTGANPIMAEFAQAQFKDNLGVEVKLEPLEPAEFSKRINAMNYQMGFYGWGADYPDPDNWLPELFGTDAGNNHTGYSNPKLDELMKKAITEPDEKKRLQMWAEAQKMVVDDAPVIFFFYDERFIVVKPYVKGLTLTGMDTTALPGNRYMNQVYLLKH